MKILSLFDGMACGMIAMMSAGVTVDTYDAYEIDKYAIKTSQHNFPMIKQHGDVFCADFTQYEGVDYVVGGESLHLLVDCPKEQQRNRSKRFLVGNYSNSMLEQ